MPQPTPSASSPGTTTVLLIRHGRSADVVPGSPESRDPGLHEVGKQQAEKLARRLASKTIDAVYASHLNRAVETARPLADQRGLEVQIVEDLQEVLLGEWGQGEFRRRAPPAIPSSSRRWPPAAGMRSRGPSGTRTCVHVSPPSCRASVTTTRTRPSPSSPTAVPSTRAFAACSGSIAHTWRRSENTSITTVAFRHGEHREARLIALNDCNHLYDPVYGPSAVLGG